MIHHPVYSINGTIPRAPPKEPGSSSSRLLSSVSPSWFGLWMLEWTHEPYSQHIMGPRPCNLSVATISKLLVGSSPCGTQGIYQIFFLNSPILWHRVYLWVYSPHYFEKSGRMVDNGFSLVSTLVFFEFILREPPTRRQVFSLRPQLESSAQDLPSFSSQCCLLLILWVVGFAFCP